MILGQRSVLTDIDLKQLSHAKATAQTACKKPQKQVTAQHSTAQHSTAQHSTAQHTAQHSTAQHSTAQHSTAQHSTAQHSTAQHSTAQHSTSCELIDGNAVLNVLEGQGPVAFDNPGMNETCSQDEEAKAMVGAEEAQ